MRIKFNLSSKSLLNEKTYTIGDTQYWKRGGKYFSWTEKGGRVEISEDDYFNALGGTTSAKKSEPKKDKSLRKVSDYSKESDESLVDLAQNGDKEAEEYIITKYQPMIRRMTSKYFLRGGDKDDLEQVATIGLWDAIKSYDVNKNDDFERYSAGIISNKIKDTIRSDSTQKAEINHQASSLDSTITGKDDNDDRSLGDTISSKEQTPEEQYIGNERARQLMDFMRTELADKERDAIFRFINGSKIGEISEETGMSYKSVENAIMRARNKIRAYREEFMSESKKYNIKVNNKFTEEEKKILESIINKINLLEASFKSNGKYYSCGSGKYYCDGEKITREEYLKAKENKDSSSSVESMGNNGVTYTDTEYGRIAHYKGEDYYLDPDEIFRLEDYDKKIEPPKKETYWNKSNKRSSSISMIDKKYDKPVEGYVITNDKGDIAARRGISQGLNDIVLFKDKASADRDLSRRTEHFKYTRKVRYDKENGIQYLD